MNESRILKTYGAEVSTSDEAITDINNLIDKELSKDIDVIYSTYKNGITIVGVGYADNLYVGVAKGSPNDHWSKDIGLQIAIGRAIKRPWSVIPIYNVDDESFYNVIVPLLYNNLLRDSRFTVKGLDKDKMIDLI